MEKEEGHTRSRASTFFFLPSNRNLSCRSDSWSTSFSTFVLFRRFTIALSRVWTWTIISISPPGLAECRVVVNTEEEGWDERAGRTSLDLFIVMKRYLTNCHISWFLDNQLISLLLLSGGGTLQREWDDGTYFEVCEWCIDNLNISICIPSIWLSRKGRGRGRTVILSFLLPTISTYPLTSERRWGKMWAGGHTFNTISFDQLSSIIDQSFR